MGKVTKKQAEQVRKAVRSQFAPYLKDDQRYPKLIDNRDRYFDDRGPDWLLVGEFAHEWALGVLSGEGGAYDDEMSALTGKMCCIPKAEGWPEGIWTEPVNGYQLAIYTID